MRKTTSELKKKKVRLVQRKRATVKLPRLWRT